MSNKILDKAKFEGKAFVICCNDAIEFVVIGSYDLAENKMKELKQQHYTQNFEYDRSISFEQYQKIYYWHIHEVDYIEQK